MQQTIILASNNSGKLKEFKALFSQVKPEIKIISQAELNICDIEETGLSFVENAILKARHAAKISGLAALADDSGLEVDYLNGEPGIYSARYSIEKTDFANNQKLLDMMQNAPDNMRSARFRCVLVYLRHALDPSPIIAEGCLEGEILKHALGDHGFGYDPLFWLPNHAKSAAELPIEVKNIISHRAQALKKLINAFAVGG